MASTFFFRAVASDGDDEGLTPIYVLFFTQELSTLFGGVGLQACAGRPRPAVRESR